MNRKISFLKSRISRAASAVKTEVTQAVSGDDGVDSSIEIVEVVPIATLYEVTTSGYEVEAHITTVLCNYANATSIVMKAGKDYNGNRVTIKKIGVGTVTIISAVGHTIDDDDSATVTNQYDSITLEFYNKNWNII